MEAIANFIRGKGRIINVSTGVTRIVTSTHPIYTASKGALETLTLALAPEFANEIGTVFGRHVLASRTFVVDFATSFARLRYELSRLPGSRRLKTSFMAPRPPALPPVPMIETCPSELISMERSI